MILFLYLFLVNLPLLLSLNKRSIHSRLGYLLEVRNNVFNNLFEDENFVKKLLKISKNNILLFRMKLKSLFLCYLNMVVFITAILITIIDSYCQYIHIQGCIFLSFLLKIYYMEYNSSLYLQEELYIGYQYSNLFI